MSQKHSDSLFSVRVPIISTPSEVLVWSVCISFWHAWNCPTQNLFCSDKLYTNNATEADVYRKNCNKKDMESGTLETGLSTATMFALYMYRNLWPMITLLLAWTLPAP